ncbi:MAG: hypothetical protein J7497_03660 [Chitinophagaceae bacterium]|nr:hypothetical protein [Chitinophagaceae bacterium]
MANQAYQLNIRLRTPSGEQLAATFFLGHSQDDADRLFNQLHGQRDLEPDAFIYFELVEIDNQLPVNLKMVSCDLEEAGVNMKLILKELFKNTLL